MQVLQVEPFRPWEELAAQGMQLAGTPTVQVRGLGAGWGGWLVLCVWGWAGLAAWGHACTGDRLDSRIVDEFSRCFCMHCPSSFLRACPHLPPFPAPLSSLLLGCCPLQTLQEQMVRLKDELFNLRMHAFHRTQEVLRWVPARLPAWADTCNLLRCGFAVASQGLCC